MYARFLKRIIDVAVALLALLLTGWLMVIVAIILRVVQGRNGVLFVQDRPGKHEKIFRLLKFKSMTDERDAEGNLLPNSERLTRIGRIIRATSIDELPQFINVLKGDMSIVGPRPLLVRYLPYYTEHEKHRHDVLPGMTGWAQVHGRNALSWNERLSLDVWYAEHVSLANDFRIVFLTVYKLFKHEGTSIEKLVPLDVERRKSNMTRL